MKILAKRLVFSLGILAVLAAVFAGCENPWMKSITAPLREDKGTPEVPADPEETTVTGVTVSPAVATVIKGGTLSFTAEVSGTGDPAQDVTWSIDEIVDAGTGISPAGFLTVAVTETASTLIVRATSVADSAVSGTAIVTVSNLPSTVTGVTVSPAAAIVLKGGTQSFTAAVNGTGSPAQTVTWSVEGAANTGTVISSTGVLTVSAAETAGTLTVQATSTANPAVSGAVTVTVTSVLTSIADIADYLANASGSPIPLPVHINLADPSPNGWADLLSAIQNVDTGKYVNLDLSLCTMNGTEFDPDASISTGKDKIASLTLPNAAESIKTGTSTNPTFKNFTSLTGVTGTNIETIGEYAFYYSILTTVDFLKVTTIGERAFQGCGALASIDLPLATSIGKFAFVYCDTLTSVNLLAATSIDEAAFAYCTSLTVIDLPASLTSIGNSAFTYCTGLTAIDIPASLTSIGGYAFSGCTGLTDITVAATNTAYSHSADHSMLLDKAGTTLVAYPTAAGNITLSGITSVRTAAFRDCTGLTAIALPNAVDIGVYAFRGCSALTAVDLPVVTVIGASAFHFCTALTTLTLPAAPPALGSGNGPFLATGSTGTVTIHVPTGAVPAYESVWGISASTGAGGNTGVYGSNHKAIEITDSP
jgi:hypothetical protein